MQSVQSVRRNRQTIFLVIRTIAGAAVSMWSDSRFFTIKSKEAGIRQVPASKGVNKLQFQIKGKDYFLAFVEDEKRWYVFSPTAQGINRIAVYIDAVKYEKPGLLEEGTRNFSS